MDSKVAFNFAGVMKSIQKKEESKDVITEEVVDGELFAHFVPTPQEVIDKMFDKIEFKESDVFYDLGCGDGRILFQAIDKFPIKAVGVELDGKLVEEARKQISEANKERVRIEQNDLFQVDFSPATCMVLYLSVRGNMKIAPKLVKEMKNNSKIVTVDFPIPVIGWDPYVEEKVIVSNNDSHKLYIYRIDDESRKAVETSGTSGFEEWKRNKIWKMG